ncbi:MAG TPA: EVE domain-containing protein [Planctomycetes bacterium]|nr:EVE domain-containing protein [Planctomycetota bacterium]
MASKKTSAKGKRPRRYWLFKSEPESYSIDQLKQDKRTFWSGVRNYQARNLLRDEILLGDGVLFYHSNAKPMAVVGIAKVVKEGYPDPTQFDSSDHYYDESSDPADPRWFVVDIGYVAKTQEPITRDMMKDQSELSDMVLLQRGSRLSVQPVEKHEWRTILKMGGVKETF